MIASLVLFLPLAIAQTSPQSTTPVEPAPTQAPRAESGQPVDKSKKMSSVRRIYVETFGNDPISQQLQAMVIASLTETKRFTVTEEKGKADAILKGAATEKSTQEVHAYGSGTAVGTAHGGSHSSISGSNGSFSGSGGGGFGAANAAIDDSSVNTESIDNAHASVRLVNPDGDVIWTTTQESRGAKFKGASADVADKIAKQLVHDAEKADSASESSTPNK